MSYCSLMSECLEWAGCRTELGYGRKAYSTEDGKHKVMAAHRWTWMQAHGPIPAGKVIRHTCDNRACVNLEHLLLGTQADNVNDMHSRGRYRPARGEQNGKSRLTEADVREARSRHQAGESVASLARAFGISPQSMTAVVRRESWAHVE